MRNSYIGVNVMVVSGELLTAIDPEGLETHYIYDMLGRCIQREHPDTGIDQYSFDNVGNLIYSQTQNLINNGGQKIRHQYNYNQLTDILYPEHPENNVHYLYGIAGDPTHEDANAVGRLYMLEDAVSYQQFAYDELGNVNKELRTFILPNEQNSYTFRMQYDYDSWGRTKNIIYPDGEKVVYNYNNAGNLASMSGRKGTEYFQYINSITYNKFGQKTEIVYGNGTYTNYTYDNLQRLRYLDTYTANNEAMQNLIYDYDAVSNIISLSNSANPLPNGLGGNYTNSYEYDELYRLVHSDGDNGFQYSLDMSYSSNGKITTKQLTADYDLNGYVYSDTYANSYQYANGNNQLTMLDGSVQNHVFQWDGNGNMIFHNNGQYKNSHCWDEENRLMLMVNKNSFGYYLYGAGGERVYKANGTVQQTNMNGQWYAQPQAKASALYASPYLVATPQGYTKHYYAGNDRIVSKIGGGGLKNIDKPIKSPKSKLERWSIYYKKQWECLENTLAATFQEKAILKNLYQFYDLLANETDLYFYHSDHLGSSAWITDANGEAIQHLQYLPFGEPRIDQRTTGWNTIYSFSGKERDEESGYSYFGARYYNSDISIWLSVDPRASSYPSLTPYNYCANSPVMVKDPNGEEIKWWGWLMMGLGIDALSGGAFSAMAGATAVGGIGMALGTMGAAVGTIDGAVGGLITGTTAAMFPFSNANYELQKYISPIAIKPPSIGSGGFGFDVSFGLMKAFGPMPAYRWHAGVSYNYNTPYGGTGGWETRTGAELSFGSISLSGTKFGGGKGQILNKLTLGGPFVNLAYENDYMFGLGAPLGRYNADGGDRWRTAAIGMNFGPFNINLNMFTGDPGFDKNNREYAMINGHNTYVQNIFGDDPNSHRAGVLSFGFGPFRFGRNSEQIRHIFQNRFAHDMLTGGSAKWFEVLNIPPSWYFYFGFGSGNTLW